MISHRRLLWIAIICMASPCVAWTATPGADGPATSPAEVREIIIVFKTHFDIGYTDLASNVVQKYRTTFMDSALEVVDQSRALPAQQQFVWTIPGWPMHKMLEDWPGQTPERQERIKRAVQDGRFVVHALPFTTHTELLELSDLVHGLGYASRLTRGCGLELPRDAKMTDVPSHSWVLPTLLRHAGVDFLHLGCNPASSSPQVPLLFWWEGPDGSRLLTMYSAASYGSGLVPPRDWPFHTWLALIHTGDNHGPPRPDEVRTLLADAQQQWPGVHVRIGRLSDFADAIRAEAQDIPVVRGDMPDTWIHGPMCDPSGARLARNLRPSLDTAEQLATLLSCWGVPCPDRSVELNAARQQSLLYGEHTWGGALSWVTQYSQKTPFWYGDAWQAERAAGRFQRLEDSWAEHSAYIENARQLAEPVLQEQLETLARSVDVGGQRIVVFNPLPWPRSDVVSLRGLTRNSAARNGAVATVAGGDVSATWTDGDRVCFVARDLPPAGYRTYRFTQAEVPAAELTVDENERLLQNRFFTAVLDPSRGSIRSLVDRQTGRELVDQSDTHGFGQYLYQRFDADQVAAYVHDYVKIDANWALTELGKPDLPPAAEAPYRAVSPEDCALTFCQSPSMVRGIMEAVPNAALSHAVTTQLTLYAGLPYADLELTVHDKPADPWPEAGWICLPFKLDAPQFRLGRLGGIVDPSRDLVPGTNRDLFAVQSGVALMEPSGFGVGICPLDSPLVSLERPGCWRYSRDFVPRKPAVFVNLFNNQWSTNFRLWNSGTWTSRVRIWAGCPFNLDTGLVTPSLEARYPLVASLAEGEAGNLSASQRGLRLSRTGVAVTAFGRNLDADALVLCLWELAGQSGRTTVTLPPGIQATVAQPVDLRGRPAGQPVQLDGNSLAVELHAFAPASFQIH